MATKPLSAREEKFCQLYSADIKRNGTQAAIGAGYSDKAAAVQASRMLRHVHIRARIRELEREAAHAATDNPEELRKHVYRQLVSLATSDITDVVKLVQPEDPLYAQAREQEAEGAEGQYALPFGDPLMYVRPTEELPTEVTAAIRSIRRTKEGLQVEMHAKDPSLRILAEAVGIVKGTGVDVSVSFGDKLERARERMAKVT
jgi:phage terminase small subunit